MDNDELGNHLPIYPDSNDPNYNGKYYSKFEFQKYSQTSYAAKGEDENSVFKNYQMLDQIYLAPQTGNRSLLIYTDPGLGKTCLSIGIAESRHEWLNQVTKSSDHYLQLNTHKALIIAQNKISLTDNFSKDIMVTCTAGAYITEKHKTKTYKNEQGKKSSETVSISTSYQLTTHGKFARKISEMKNHEIAKQFSGRVIILDEAHQLRTILKNMETDDGEIMEGTGLKKGTKFAYEQISRFFNNIYNCIIIVLTATPTVNDINEFVAIANLVLPKDDQIDPQIFSRIARLSSNEEMMGEMENYIGPKLMGRVSRMKLSKSLIKSIVRFNDDPKAPLVKLAPDKRLYVTRVDNNNDEEINYNYILDVYSRALRANNLDPTNQDAILVEDNFYMDSLYVTNMIWPGGIYGDEAFKLYLRKTDLKYEFTDAFLEDFRRRVNDTRTREILLNQHKIERLKETITDANRESVEEKIDELETNIELFASARGKLVNGIWDGIYDPIIPDNLDDDKDYERIFKAQLDMNTMLDTIKTYYSPVYASVIKIIIGVEVLNPNTGIHDYIATPKTNSFGYNQDNRECAYIYNFYKAGGIVPCCLLLELFGYKQLTADEILFDSKGRILMQPAKRFAMIFNDSKMVTSGRMTSILSLANHPENKYGHYLKVIGGTDVSAQGINFKNIRQTHLTSRKWNEAGNFQAEGRVDRMNSQAEFDDTDIPNLPTFEGQKIGVTNLNGRDTQRYVKIFRHVAVYSNNLMSIGIKMYEYAAMKEKVNSVVLSILDRISYNRILNQMPDDETPLALIGFERVPSVDYSTYNIFYAKKEVETIKCRIRWLFKTHSSLSLSKIYRLFQNESHYSTVIIALTQMVNEDERLLDRHGMLNYLREDNDIFFLQKLPRVVGPTILISGTSKRSPTYNRAEQWQSYYTKHNFVKDADTVDDMTDKIDRRIFTNTLDKIYSLVNPTRDQVSSLLNSMSNQTKGVFIENIVTKSIDIKSEYTNLIFQALDPSAIYFPNNRIIVHSFFLKTRQENQGGGRATFNKLPVNTGGLLRLFFLSKGVWENSTEDIDKFIVPIINNYILTKVGKQIGEFSHIGYSNLEGGKHIFKVNDRVQLETSRNTRTQQGKITEKGPSGRKIETVPKSKQIEYIWSIELNIYVLVKLYDNQNILLYRMEKSLTPEGNVIWIPTKNKRGEIDSIVRYPDKQGGNFIGQTIIHYTHLYPEIMPWAFRDIITQRLDIDAIINKEDFFPYINQYYYFPEYIDVLEYDGFAKLLPTNVSENLYKVKEVVKTSYDLLYKDLIYNRLPYIIDESVPPELSSRITQPDIIGNPIDDPINSGRFMQYGIRFKIAWDLATQKDLGIVIFLAFYLRQSIVDLKGFLPPLK